MRTRLQLVLLFLLASAALAAAGEVIDRILVVVNSEVILASDLDEEVRFEALLNDKPLEKVTAADRHDVLDRLVDHTLILQQMRPAEVEPPTLEEMHVYYQGLREQIPGGNDDAGWQALLDRYGLTEEEFEFRAGVQFKILRFVDMRFRPMVRVDRASVEQYYKEKLLPQLDKPGAQPPPPLREVYPKIEELLVQEQIDQLLVAWLHTLRTQGDIRMHPATVEPGREGAGVP